METRAYNMAYLPYAMENLATMMDCGINQCGFSPQLFYRKFLTSGVAGGYWRDIHHFSWILGRMGPGILSMEIRKVLSLHSRSWQVRRRSWQNYSGKRQYVYKASKREQHEIISLKSDAVWIQMTTFAYKLLIPTTPRLALWNLRISDLSVSTPCNYLTFNNFKERL